VDDNTPVVLRVLVSFFREHGGEAEKEATVRRSHKGGGGIKTDADTALDSLVGHDIYVYGTGGAREVRRDGVLRKVIYTERKSNMLAHVCMYNPTWIRLTVLAKAFQVLRKHIFDKHLVMNTSCDVHHKMG